MIFKQSMLVPSDLCGVWLVKTFHLYKGFKRKISRLGDFIKVSVRVTKPRNWIKKKRKLVAIFLKSKYMLSKLDGSSIKFKVNNCVLLKRRMTPKGDFLYGPIPLKIRRRKFMMTFVGRI